MGAPSDDELRESARHRGLKLVKSRRRKPGGDFGLFGLVAPDGTPRLGMSDAGLTATAEDVARFLRKGDAATWASSVEATPERAPDLKPVSAETETPDRKPPAGTSPRQKRAAKAQTAAAKPAKPPATSLFNAAPPAKPAPRHDPDIRPAIRRDAEQLSALIPDADVAILAERIAAASASAEPVLVAAAEDGTVLGCLAWHVLPTLQHGPVARLTLLVVHPQHRRKGIGRLLLSRWATDAASRGVTMLEAASDIALGNAHGFFRRLGFTQASYRFTREDGQDD
ncbi:L-amino acid N-acyltransferase YncA [Sphingomonas gellani]|uniref:L-amino acid N-acyltransferase YncA n=1 Tax=Sphingomonas gellani TaxID=1166340 RepID=A0A1H8EHB1_9SPHN|nr:GNAT family N-acetyltransferase [Sphingomonas gellani]SEN18168.1 L-amino acid N-acyltransferase YncA [Sphingomonas gellani]